MLLAMCVYGQNSRMYCLMAYQEGESRGSYLSDPTVLPDYLRLLMTIQGDTLAIFDTLNPQGGRRLIDVAPLPFDETLFLVEADISRGIEPKQLSLINYSGQTIVLSTLNIKLDRTSFRYSYMQPFRRNDRYSISLFTRPMSANRIYQNTIMFAALDKNFNLHLLSPSDFKTHFSLGNLAPLFGEMNWPEIYYYVNQDFSTLKITDYMLHDRPLPDAPYQIPIQYRDTTTKRVVVQVQTPTIFVGNYIKLSRQGSCQRIFAVCDSGCVSIDTLQLSCDSNYHVGLAEDWLLGTITLTKVDTTKWGGAKNLQWHQLKEENATLYRDDFDSRYGQPEFVLDRAKTFFFYHIPSKRQFRMHVAHQNSEILLMRDSMMYYCVHDEIRQVKLDNKRARLVRGTDCLVVKDSRFVPYIHHIFFSATEQDRLIREEVELEDIWEGRD